MEGGIVVKEVDKCVAAAVSSMSVSVRLSCPPAIQ